MRTDQACQAWWWRLWWKHPTAGGWKVWLRLRPRGDPSCLWLLQHAQFAQNFPPLHPFRLFLERGGAPILVTGYEITSPAVFEEVFWSWRDGMHANVMDYVPPYQREGLPSPSIGARSLSFNLCHQASKSAGRNRVPPAVSHTSVIKGWPLSVAVRRTNSRTNWRGTCYHTLLPRQHCIEQLHSVRSVSAGKEEAKTAPCKTKQATIASRIEQRSRA